jgi:hypothetical protein
MRVSQVESKPIVFESSSKKGFAVATVFKSEMLGRGSQVPAQNRPEQATRNDEIVTMLLEAKTAGPGMFVLR